MPDPTDFMQFQDGLLSRPGIHFAGIDFPAISAPVPADATVVRFVGRGPRYLQIQADTGVLIRDGELWMLPAEEAAARPDVQPYRSKATKPAPASPEADADKGTVVNA